MKKFFLSAAVLLALNSTANAELIIGFAGPLTGGSAALGDQSRNGVNQAVADINEKGGVLGEKIRVQFEDDAGDPRQAISVANRMVAEGIKFVIGHQNSGASIPASEVYAEAGTVMISPSSTNPMLTERGLTNVFRTCGRDDQQGIVAAEYLLKTYAGKKLFIVHDKTQYGLGIAEEVKKGVNAGGLVEVGYEGITVGEKDYSALISKIRETNADVVYFGGIYTEGALIVRQMRESGMSAPFLGGDGLFSSEFAAIAGPQANGSTLVTFGSDPTKNPAAKDVLKHFVDKGVNPEGNTFYAYAGVQVIAQAITAVGTADAGKVAEKIHSGMAFDTVLGPLTFDEKGDIKKLDFVFYKLQNGKFVEN